MEAIISAAVAAVVAGTLAEVLAKDFTGWLALVAGIVPLVIRTTLLSPRAAEWIDGALVVIVLLGLLPLQAMSSRPASSGWTG